MIPKVNDPWDIPVGSVRFTGVELRRPYAWHWLLRPLEWLKFWAFGCRWEVTYKFEKRVS